MTEVAHAEVEAASTHRRGIVAIAGAALIFSFGALAFKGRAEATDWQFLTYRSFSVVAVMSGLLVYRHRTGLPTVLRRTRWQHVVAGFLLGLLFTLFITALARTTAATTLLLQSASPIAAAVLAFVVLGERVARRTWIAIGAAGVGIALMVWSGLDTGRASGVLLAALIPVGFATYSVLLRSAPNFDPLVPVVIAGLAAGSVAATMALRGPGLSVPVRDAVLGCIAGGVLLGIGLPLLNWGHRSVPAAEVSLLLLIESVFAPVWVWIWPGEQPAAGTLAGGAIVVAAVVYLSRFGRSGPGVSGA